jgi:hypothetical protein
VNARQYTQSPACRALAGLNAQGVHRGCTAESLGVCRLGEIASQLTCKVTLVREGSKGCKPFRSEGGV